MHNLNTSLFQSVYQCAGRFPALDSAAVLITSEITYAVIFVIVVALLFVIPFLTKDISKRVAHFGQGVVVLLSLGVTFFVVSLLKMLVAHPRPFVVLAEVRPLVTEMPFESFPSAHAALTMALALSVLPFYGRIGKLLIAFSLVVGLSRMYVGVHYPFDVIAGFAIGGVISYGIVRVFRK